MSDSDKSRALGAFPKGRYETLFSRDKPGQFRLYVRDRHTWEYFGAIGPTVDDAIEGVRYEMAKAEKRDTLAGMDAIK